MTTFVGSAKGTNTATAPSHVAGDLMLVVTTRNASATAPTLVSGFINIGTSTANTNSIRAAFKICTSTSDAVGTWTNATECVVHIYRPSAGNAAAIGANAFGSGSSATASYTGLTLFDGSTSWIAAIGQTKTASVGIATAPSTFVNTNGQDEVGTGELASFDTNGAVSTSATQTVTITSGVWKTFTVEIRDVPSTSPAGFVSAIASSSNLNGVQGEAGNAFIFFKDWVGAGNCLVIGMTWASGTTVTSIVDSVNGTWPAATQSADNGAGANISAMFVFPNSAAGTNVQFTVTFSAATIPWQCDIAQFSGIATSSTAAGSAGTAGVAGPNPATGSYTPTNNNATGGNLLLAYYCVASLIAGSNPAMWFPRGGFTLIEADNSWTTNQGFPHAMQGFVQTTSAAINPTINAFGDSTDTFNCISVALKLASGAGTPWTGGIHVDRILHFSSTSTPATWTIQFPFTGNTLALTFTDCASITGVVDSQGGTWNKRGGSVSNSVIWDSYNRTPSSNFFVSITMGAASTGVNRSARFFDISGAAASPFDNTQSTATTTIGTVTSISNWPTITPSTSNGLIVACAPLGQGPGLSLTSPTGGCFDLCTYTGETDGSSLENADLTGHYYNPNTTTVNFGWTITSQVGNSSDATAVAYIAAPIASSLVAPLMIPRHHPQLNRGLLILGSITQVQAVALTALGASRGQGTARFSGTTSIAGLSRSNATGRAAPAGVVPLSARATSTGAGRNTATVVLALAARAASMATGRMAAVGTAAMAALGKSTARGTAVPDGTVPLAGTGASMGTGRGSIVFLVPLTALSRSIGRAVASATVAASLAGRSQSNASGRAAPAGTVPLRGMGAAKAIGRGAMGLLAPLAGLSRAMGRGGAAMGAAAALAARSVSMATGRAVPSGTVPLSARSQSMATGRILFSTAGQIFLFALSRAQASGRAAATGVAAMTGRATSLAAGRLVLSVSAPLGALSGSGAGMAKGFANLIGKVGLSARSAGVASGAPQLRNVLSLQTTSVSRAKGGVNARYVAALATSGRSMATGPRGSARGTVFLRSLGKAIARAFAREGPIALPNPNLIARAAVRALNAIGARRFISALGGTRARVVVGVSNHIANPRDLTPPIDAALEQELVTFDYSEILTNSANLISINELTCSVSFGTDATPGARILSAPSIIASPRNGIPASSVVVLVGNMLADVTYRLQCVVNTSDGQILSLWCRLACDEPD